MHPERQEAAHTDIDMRRGVGPDGNERVSLLLPATNLAVRSAISTIRGLVNRTGCSSKDAAQLEIALAEVFNNIVEHAYADRTDGMIDVTLEMSDTGIHFTFLDTGAPMPTGRLASGHTADPKLAAHEQPEGGYGLHLLRTCVRKLRYSRNGDTNCLTFRFRATPA